MIESVLASRVENVKLGIECCLERYSRCNGCPYFEDSYRSKCENNLLKDALDVISHIDLHYIDVRFVFSDEQRSDNENG